MEIISKIPFVRSPVDFITLNPEANQAFVSHNQGDSISLIDFTSKTKSKLIEIERPRDIIFEPNLNRVYAIYGKSGFFMPYAGKKLCVIDVKTKQIIKDIGNKEGFGGISRNSKTNKIYVTQPNKKKVWKIDEKSLDVEDKISVKGQYRQIIVNENTDDLILVEYHLNRSEGSISRYIANSNKVEKIFSQFKWNLKIEEFSMKFYPKLNKIFAHLSTSHRGVGRSDSRIHIIDYDKPDSKSRITSKHRIIPDFDLDASNNFIYYVQIVSAWQPKKHQIVKRNLATNSEEIFDIELVNFGLSRSVFRVHPQTGHLLFYGMENRQMYLVEISIP
ncbi:MAG: hypothetical protein IIA83_01360 [Thaumarchaeota archaeon]|nr:hypothetical protein [Nitrososphaerota archaeon]